MLNRGIRLETLTRILETYGAPFTAIEIDGETLELPARCYFLPAFEIALSVTVDLPKCTSQILYGSN